MIGWRGSLALLALGLFGSASNAQIIGGYTGSMTAGPADGPTGRTLSGPFTSGDLFARSPVGVPISSNGFNGGHYQRFARWFGYGFGDGYHACPCPRGQGAGLFGGGHCAGGGECGPCGPTFPFSSNGRVPACESGCDECASRTPAWTASVVESAPRQARAAAPGQHVTAQQAHWGSSASAPRVIANASGVVARKLSFNRSAQRPTEHLHHQPRHAQTQPGADAQGPANIARRPSSRTTGE